MQSRNVLAIALLTAASSLAVADEAIDFGHYHVENIPAGVIEAAISATGTVGLNGIALGPGETLYVLHADESEAKTLFQLDPTADPATITVLATDSELKTDLGFSGTIIVEGGFTSSPDGEILYFFVSDSDDLEAELHLVAFDSDAIGAKATIIASGEDVEGVEDVAVLPNGKLVLARGHDGVGIIDPADTTPSFELKVSDQDFVDDLVNNHGFPGSTDEAEAESIAVDPVTGQVLVFLHEVTELYEIIDIDMATPSLQRIVVSEWQGLGAPVDMHGMVMDGEGVLYGFDEGNEAIVVWDGSVGHVVALDDIHDELAHGHDKVLHGDHGDFGPTEYRGLAVRRDGEGDPVLFMAMNNDEDGVVMVEFGDDHGHTSVGDWMHY